MTHSPIPTPDSGRCRLPSTPPFGSAWAQDENQGGIPRAGGIPPLVALLSRGSEVTQQYTAAALEALARDHTDNQIALAKAGAIEPLVSLLGSDTKETQEHATSALLYLASHDEESRNAVVKKLVVVLDARNAAAQLQAARALAVLAARTTDNRKAITAADAVPRLVRLLGDGRRVRTGTPQERAAACLADLSRLGENKLSIVTEKGVPPLVMILSSDSPEARTHAAATIWNLCAIGANKQGIADNGAISPLVSLLRDGTPDAQKYATGALWHLAATAANKQAMVSAGAIPPLIGALQTDMADAREYAAAVLSAISRTQGGNKKAIFRAGGIRPLIELLSDSSIMTQRHAACALWGLAEGKEGVYDKQMVEQGAVQPLIAILMMNHEETRGFAAACLSAICADEAARAAIIDAGGTAPLLALAQSPTAWLRSQATQMLQLLGIENKIDPDDLPPGYINSPRYSPRHSPRGHLPGGNSLPSPRPLPSPGRMGAGMWGPVGSSAAGSAATPPSMVHKALAIREAKSIDQAVENKV